MHKAIKK